MSEPNGQIFDGKPVYPEKVIEELQERFGTEDVFEIFTLCYQDYHDSKDQRWPKIYFEQYNRDIKKELPHFVLFICYPPEEIIERLESK